MICASSPLRFAIPHLARLKLSAAQAAAPNYGLGGANAPRLGKIKNGCCTDTQKSQSGARRECLMILAGGGKKSPCPIQGAEKAAKNQFYLES